MFAFLMTAAALLHPVHETLSEIEWNEQTKVLEVAVRLDALDEQWLRKQHGREDDISSWAVGYLRRNFRVDAIDSPTRRERSRYRWVGRDEEGSHVWWYFEIEPENQKMPVWIEQRMMFEREEGFTNRILILGQVPRRSLTLTIGRPKARLDQAQDDAPSAPPPDRRSHLDRR